MARPKFSAKAKLTQLESQRRKIIGEDQDWTLVIVPSLSNLCLQSIVTNFEEYPIYDKLPPIHKDFVHEKLSTSLKLHVTANLISDGTYWERCCKQLWKLCVVSNYGNSWKRMFFERHMQDTIEKFVPNVTDPKTVLELVPFCENYVKKLDISQLLPPIKEDQKEEDKYTSESESDDESERPPMDHFEFDILLHKLTNLEELHLVYIVKECGMNFEWYMLEMTDRDCESLGKAVVSCKTLKILKLQGHVEDSRCRKLVKYLLGHPTLRELDLSHNLIGDRGARAIGKLLNNSKLQTLNMCDNIIRGPGAKAIAHALSKNSTLLSLNLRLNYLRDNGGEAIAKALMNNHNLRHLHLGANDITEITAIALAKVLYENKTLRSINLSCNKLGVYAGKALEEALAYNTSLTDCDIRLTEVDEETVNSINQVVWTNQNLKLKKRTQEIKTT